MMRRLAIVAVGLVAVFVAFGPGAARPVSGHTYAGWDSTGSFDAYVWSGSVTGHVSVEARFTITVQPGGRFYGRWETNQYWHGAAGFAVPSGGTATTWTVSKVNTPQAWSLVGIGDTYMAFHVFPAPFNAGTFTIRNASVVAVDGVAPTPGPTASPPPSATPDPSASPTPTPIPSVSLPPPSPLPSSGEVWLCPWPEGYYGPPQAQDHPDPGCWLVGGDGSPYPSPPPTGGVCYDDHVWRELAGGSYVCLASLDLGATYPAGTAIFVGWTVRYDGNWSGHSKMWDYYIVAAGSAAAAVVGLNEGSAGSALLWGEHSTGRDSMAGDQAVADTNTVVTFTGSTRYLWLVHHARFAGGSWVTNGASEMYWNLEAGNGGFYGTPATPMPSVSPSPSPSASPSGSPGPTPIPGTGIGDHGDVGRCSFDGNPLNAPMFTACVTVQAAQDAAGRLLAALSSLLGGVVGGLGELGDRLMGGLGAITDKLQELLDQGEGQNEGPAPSIVPGSGVPSGPVGNTGGTCEAEYPKVGQAAYDDVPPCEFPGLTWEIWNYLGWLGCLIGSFGTVLANALRWVFNFGIDLVVPSQCLEDGYKALVDLFWATPPMVWMESLGQTLETALSTPVGGAQDLSFTVMNAEVVLPLEWAVDAGWGVRSVLVPVVALGWLVALVRLVYGFLHGGGEGTA